MTKMDSVSAKMCPVRLTTDDWSDDLLQAKVYCDTCSVPGPNLWLCLHADCFYVGCGDAADDHSTQHFDVCGLLSL